MLGSIGDLLLDLGGTEAPAGLAGEGLGERGWAEVGSSLRLTGDLDLLDLLILCGRSFGSFFLDFLSSFLGRVGGTT